MSLSDFKAWVRKHKLASIIAIPLIAITSLIGLYQYHAYSEKFSEKDYDQLTSMAEAVLKNSGGKDIQVSRTCSYERPQDFSNLHLYCKVAMATYIPYVNDKTTTKLAMLLLHDGDSTARPLDSPTSFYASPKNNALTIFVRPLAAHQSKQCRFEIATLRFAMKLGIGLPDNTNSNLVAISFYCSAESRAEYFPVTYRQG